MIPVSVCPDCGAQREISSSGEFCPSCHLLVGLQGIDEPVEESLTEVAEKTGDQIDRFELMEEIGEGGFGVVFRAIQHKPVQRVLALKVIKPGMDSREIVARFEAERQALALMNHSHIAKVYDAGTTVLGRPFFVMELVEGLPLTTFCDRHQLTIGERLQLFMKICSGVQHAHQKGIIHRDLKPSNLLVHFDDNNVPCPKIIDFGVAKAIGIELTEQTFFTLFGRLVGTPEYMSPEQAELNALDVDTRSDIYSLGIVLHELLTGCVPLTREQLTKNGYDEMRRLIREQEATRASSRYSSLDKDTRDQIARARKTDPQQLDRRIRYDLDWIVMKAIEKNRNRRYETAQALGSDVERYLAGLPVNASPPSKTYRVGKFILRHRLGVALAGLALVGLIAGVILQQISSLEAVARAEEAKKALRASLILSATKHREAQGEGWLSAALNDIREASKIHIAEDLRNEALAILAGSDLEKEDLELFLGDPELPVAFSADHGMIALARRSDQIEILTLPDKARPFPPVATELPVANCQLTFAGQGNRYLIIAADPNFNEKIEVIDLKSGEACFPAVETRNQAFDLLPDGQGIAIAQKGSISFLDWKGELLRPTLALDGNPISLALSRATGRLAVGFKSPSGNVREGLLSIFRYPSGEKLPLDRSGFEPWILSWSPSGKYLAMADNDKGLTAFEPGAVNTDHILSGHSTEVRRITWSPDDRLLATATDFDRDIRLWDASHWQLLSTHGALGSNFSFSPDGGHLGPVIADERLFSLRVINSEVCHHAVGHRGRGGIVASAWDMRISTDSENPREDRYSLAFATAGNDSVIIWDRKGRDLARFQDVTRPAGVAFSDSCFYMAGEEGLIRRKTLIIPKEPFGPFLEQDLTPCVMHFEPAEGFSKLTHCRKIDITPDGRLLAVAAQSGIWLVDTELEQERLVEEAAPDTCFDIDPGGRWLAIGGSKSSTEGCKTVRIYKLPLPEEPLSEGKLIKELSAAGVTAVAFSEVLGDGRGLVATGDSTRYRFWNVNQNWAEQTHLEIPAEEKQTTGRIVFSPRSTALAVSYARDKLKVLDPRNMEVLTRPGFDSQWPLAISQDGALIGTEGHDGRLFIWDLKAVRDEFKNLGIDWEKLSEFKRPADLHILIGVSVDDSPREQGQ